MKKKLLFSISACILALILSFSCVLMSKQNSDYVSEVATVRTVEVESQNIDCESIFNQFQNAKLEHDGLLTTFEGYQPLKLSDLMELDNLSESEIQEVDSTQIKYNFSYDHETNLVTLNVIMIGETEETLIDTVIGAAFVNEKGELDAVLDLDGEYILLSEMQDSGMIENCGWFKKALKKVKKVVKTTTGKVAATLTVAAPLVIGVIGACTGIGLVATIAAGAVAGAAIMGTATALETYSMDGKVDWGAVGLASGIGAAVGAVASAVGYGIGAGIKSACTKMTGTDKISQGKGYKSFESFKKENGLAGENKAWHHIVEQHSDNIAKFGNEAIHNTGNLVKIPSGYKGSLHSKITGFYKSNNKAITGSANMSVRSWLSTKSFDFQYQFGVEKLLEFAKELGITVILP